MFMQSHEKEIEDGHKNAIDDGSQHEILYYLVFNLLPMMSYSYSLSRVVGVGFLLNHNKHYPNQMSRT